MQLVFSTKAIRRPDVFTYTKVLKIDNTLLFKRLSWLYMFSL